MTLRGEEIAAPYRKWLDNEVSNVPAVRTDLGKFFFGVSTGTVAMFIGLEKTGFGVKMDKLLVVSLLLTLASMIIALFMAKPPLWRLTSSTDIFAEHDKHVEAVSRYVWAWLALWLLALVPWVVRLLFSA